MYITLDVVAATRGVPLVALQLRLLYVVQQVQQGTNALAAPKWSVDDLMDSTFVRLHLIHFPCKWSGDATSLIGMVSNLQHAMQHAHAHAHAPRSLALLCSILVLGWAAVAHFWLMEYSSLTVFGCISLSFVAPPISCCHSLNGLRLSSAALAFEPATK